MAKKKPNYDDCIDKPITYKAGYKYCKAIVAHCDPELGITIMSRGKKKYYFCSRHTNRLFEQCFDLIVKGIRKGIVKLEDISALYDAELGGNPSAENCIFSQ